MPRFVYTRPGSIEETLRQLEAHGFKNKILAGGTDLLIDLRNEVFANSHLRLVDISRIPELHRIERRDEQVIIGAAATFSEIITSPLLQSSFSILVEACGKIGSPQIRNSGTIGGNIVNAAACADTLPVLACLRAQVRLQSARGTRDLPLEHFILGKNQPDLNDGELLTHIHIPLLPAETKGAFIKLGRRNAQTTSRLTLAVLGHSNAGRVVDMARVVPGSLTDKIRFYPEAETLLLGCPPTPQQFRLCSQKVVEDLARDNGKRWSSDYKIPVLAKLIERALTQVFL